MDYRKRKNINKVIYSRPFLLVFFMITAFFVYTAISIVPKVFETRKNKNMMKAEFENLTNREGKLKSETERMQSEEGIEENLREKFRVAKEGEGLIIIVDEEGKEEVKYEEKKGFLHFFKNLFR
jgi:cell division protein FtsB